MAKVSTEIAKADIQTWLDFKKISQKKQDSQKDSIDSLVAEIEEGNLVLNEDKTFTYILKFPTEGEISIKEIKFKPRLKVGSAHISLQGNKTGDIDARILSYVVALTDTAKEVIKKFDSEDYGVCQSIAVFFIS